MREGTEQPNRSTTFNFDEGTAIRDMWAATDKELNTMMVGFEQSISLQQEVVISEENKRKTAVNQILIKSKDLIPPVRDPLLTQLIDKVAKTDDLVTQGNRMGIK